VDYQDYINGLPQRERVAVNKADIDFYELGIQRAVEIMIPIDGIFWKHVLVYDTDGQRVRVIKYASARYRS